MSNQSTAPDKATLVNSIAILLSCQQHTSGIAKLTIPTLNAMYQGLLSNANSWSHVKEEAMEAKRKAFVSEKRVESLEAEVAKLKAKIKNQSHRKG